MLVLGVPSVRLRLPLRAGGAGRGRRGGRGGAAAALDGGLRPRSSTTRSSASRDDPLSTFSIDVDTASLRQRPPVPRRRTRCRPTDAVRIEELVNYFPYDYPPPDGDAPVRRPRRGRPTARGTPSTGWCASASRAARSHADKRPPSNLVFLIDVSGSMNAPNKLPLVKQALTLLVEQLDARTTAWRSSSTPARRAWCCPRRRATSSETILEAIDRLRGRRLDQRRRGHPARLRQVARENFIKGGINRVILGHRRRLQRRRHQPGRPGPADRGEGARAACS